MKRTIDQSIIATLAFYETKGCGRTVDQLLPYLVDCTATRAKLERALDRLVESGRVLRVGDDYGLSAESAARAADAGQWVDRKRPIAAKIARVMERVPFVRMVALTQSVAMETARESSDVDVFTIAASNRLWTARFLALAKLKRMGLAKRKGGSADHGCFGFWVDESALSLSRVAIDSDIYLSFWLAHAVPLVNKNKTYERFVSKNNRLLSHFPNWRRKSPLVPLSKGGDQAIHPLWQRGVGGDFAEWFLGGRIGNLVELFLFKFQTRKIWRDDIAHREGASVVTDRHMCKLHHFDQRAAIRDEWMEIVETW